MTGVQTCALPILDETYFRESFKGNHTKSAVFVMPRKAHKRTKALRKRGLSKEQICVATGVDDAGRSFLTVCGRGIISKDRAMSALKVHIGRGTDVLTDGAPAYVKPLAELGANLTQASADGHAINRVNTLHARLEDFMFGFHGVSTKYLQAYLDWFQWLVAFTDGFGETDDDRLLARYQRNKFLPDGYSCLRLYQWVKPASRKTVLDRKSTRLNSSHRL